MRGTATATVLALGLAAIAIATPAAAQAPRAAANATPTPPSRGADLYAARCAACHDQPNDRAPARAALSRLTPDAIERALTTGVMQGFAQGLTAADKAHIAAYITGTTVAAATTPPAASRPVLMCATKADWFDFKAPPVLAGGLDPANTRSLSSATAGITRANVGSLRLKWAFAFPGATRARSGAAMAGGAIFVGSQDGTVYALDRETGCARWTFKAEAEVRNGLNVSEWPRDGRPAKPLVFFGDTKSTVYALDAVTGAKVWTDKADAHPSAILTGTPKLHDGVLYVPVSSLEAAVAANVQYECCTFRGSVIAYDAVTGKRRWQTFMTPPAVERGVTLAGTRRFGPSGAGIWSSPTIDEKRGRIYVATGNNYSSPATNMSDSIVALNRKDGRIVWVTQVLAHDAWNQSCASVDKRNCPEENGPDYDLSTGAVLSEGSDGHDYLVVGQKSGLVHGLRASDGKQVWRTQVGLGGVEGGFQFGMAAQGGAAIAPMKPLPRPNRTAAPDARQGMFAIDLVTGNYLWRSPGKNMCDGRRFCVPGYGAAITATPELIIAGSSDGQLRALDRASGAVVWEFETSREFTAVNGDVARGGAMGGVGSPLADRGLLVVSSGFNEIPGNALLVFSTEP